MAITPTNTNQIEVICEWLDSKLQTLGFDVLERVPGQGQVGTQNTDGTAWAIPIPISPEIRGNSIAIYEQQVSVHVCQQARRSSERYRKMIDVCNTVTTFLMTRKEWLTPDQWHQGVLRIEAPVDEEVENQQTIHFSMVVVIRFQKYL